MPHNTKKCECPVPNGIFKQKGRTAWYECSKCGKGVEFTIKHTPSLDKSEHDGTCRTPECYEKRLTPAVEDWEGKVKNVFEDLREELTNIDYSEKYILDIVRSLRESDRKRIECEIDRMIAEELSAKPSDEIEKTAEWYRVSALKNLKAFITNLK